MVCLVSSSVFCYNLFYMGEGEDQRRFFYLLLLFVGSMGVLVFSCSIFVTMVGWDGLGLVSFLLVIYYICVETDEHKNIKISHFLVLKEQNIMS